MYAYDHVQLSSLLQKILQDHISPEASAWLAGEAGNDSVSRFNGAFARVPRKTGKGVIRLSPDAEESVSNIRKDFTISGWTVDRLARVWLLMQLNADDRSKYFERIEGLFLAAEMSELVALYSALPVLAHPPIWQKRCAEGIRSNIGQVLEAVICRNPYPAEQLDELAWNQLVLKALFTEKPVLDIVGLRERRNKNLALSLTDYAHERWAAHRDVNPLLWLCVAPYINDENIADIRRLFASADMAERSAAGLVCYESDFPAAKALLEQFPEIKSNIENGQTSWPAVAALQLSGEKKT